MSAVGVWVEAFVDALPTSSFSFIMDYASWDLPIQNEILIKGFIPSRESRLLSAAILQQWEVHTRLVFSAIFRSNAIAFTVSLSSTTGTTLSSVAASEVSFGHCPVDARSTTMMFVDVG
ncbi:hypothetical protein D9613_008304 [Agrocybe pediades]|uniref:Uncharacterized protein n=1 Tax=Agrocybe pediades TaxID=84607 RepID=A0A8H4VQI0_9AGAR|nr:hypothetical protein D9613_008304 [Agrocybe pediades]